MGTHERGLLRKIATAASDAEAARIAEAAEKEKSIVEDAGTNSPQKPSTPMTTAKPQGPAKALSLSEMLKAEFNNRRLACVTPPACEEIRAVVPSPGTDHTTLIGMSAMFLL